MLICSQFIYIIDNPSLCFSEQTLRFKYKLRKVLHFYQKDLRNYGMSLRVNSISLREVELFEIRQRKKYKT